MLACSWAWVLPWSMIGMPSVTPLKKTDFPFPCRFLLQIASWLGVRPVSTSPSPWWAKLVRHNPSYVDDPCCALKTPRYHPSPLALRIFPPPFQLRFLSLDSRGWSHWSWVFPNLPLSAVSSCRSVLGPICCKKLHWWGCVMCWSMGTVVYH